MPEIDDAIVGVAVPRPVHRGLRPERVPERGRLGLVGDGIDEADAQLVHEVLSELLGQEFSEEGLSTVGGLVYESFGRVPRAGEAMLIGAYKLVVERVRGRRIQRVYFERQHAEQAEASE